MSLCGVHVKTPSGRRERCGRSDKGAASALRHFEVSQSILFELPVSDNFIRTKKVIVWSF